MQFAISNLNEATVCMDQRRRQLCTVMEKSPNLYKPPREGEGS